MKKNCDIPIEDDNQFTFNLNRKIANYLIQTNKLSEIDLISSPVELSECATEQATLTNT